MTALRALLFDKDGTLFDFNATWNAWAGGVIWALSDGDAGVASDLAGVLRYDLEKGHFFDDSPVIAGTNREVAEHLAPLLPSKGVDALEAFLASEAARAPLAQAAPLPSLLDELSAMGLILGVMTNDSAAVADAHLAAAGVRDRFAWVAGADSGYGAKPAPGPLLAFARAQALSGSEVAMIGDSTHDLRAGRAAGMTCIGVLTGMARAEDLAPWADTVLPDIGHLPGWLRQSVPEND